MSVRRGTAVDHGAADGRPAEAPDVRGDLDELMDHRPVFRVRLHGYDRLDVDNYTAWAEGELVTVRRQVDHLLSRFGECSAELEISRRLLAEAPRGRDAFPVSARVQEMLRLASDEAAALTEAGAQEAERIVAEARTEADARLRKAHQIKQMAAEAADELLAQARRDRARAAAEVERATSDAAAQLAALQAEVDDLRRQRDQARQSLRGLSDRIGEALAAVADLVPADAPRTHVVTGNHVMTDGVMTDPEDRDDADVVVMVGRPSAVPH